MAEEKTLLLTQEAYDKMKEELAWREGEYRDEILSKVSAARAEGDLSENGGYQAAREAQRVNQGRIEELTVKLRNAKILTAPKAGEVGDGSLVTLDVNGREMVYVLRHGLQHHQPGIPDRRSHQRRSRGRHGVVYGSERT